MEPADLKITRPGIIPVRKWNAVMDLLQSAMITSFTGGWRSRTIMGTALGVGDQGGSSSEPDHPFKVRVFKDDDKWKAWVNEESDLLLSFQPSDNQTVTGLGYDNALEILQSGDLVYLNIEWAPNITGDVASAEIQTWGTGGSFNPVKPAWDESFDGFIWDDDGEPPVQQGLSIPLAQATFDEDGNPTVIQMTRNHLSLVMSNVDGRPAYTAEPGYGRYQT